MNDEEIRKKYDVMPNMDGNVDYIQHDIDFFLPVLSIMICLIAFFVLIYISNDGPDEIAHEVYDIKTDKFTCDELADKLKPYRISSWHSDYYIRDALYDRLYTDECISYDDKQRMQDEDLCRTHNSIECRVKAIAAKETAVEDQRWKKR